MDQGGAEDGDVTGPGTPAGAEEAEPDWLQTWRRGRLDAAEAVDRFASLAEIATEAMIGRWRGAGLASGHPLDGMLEAFGWHGKAFDSAEAAYPLLARSRSGAIVSVDPARIPLSLLRRWPGPARSPLAQAAFARMLKRLASPHPTARLRQVAYRGRLSAAIIYDRQPVIDHLRRIDGARVLGLVDMRGDAQPLFFLLTRESPAAP